MKLRQRLQGAWILPLSVCLDQAAKALAQGWIGSWLDPIGLFRLHLVYNTGMAFSMLSNSPAVLNTLTILLVAALVLWLMLRPEGLNKEARAGLWLVAGGGLSNLIDRLRLGYVLDFIETSFIPFPIFNLADCFVVGGAFLTIAALVAEEWTRRRES